MKIPLRTTTAVTLILALCLCIASSSLARRTEVGPVRYKSDAIIAADAQGERVLLVHDVGNVRMTLSNWGEQGNPDGVPGYFGFEFPLGAETDFLFSSGIWVGAIKNGEKLVSTGTDGDDGTNEFSPSVTDYTHYWVDDNGNNHEVVIEIPGRDTEHPYYFRTSKSLSVVETAEGGMYCYTKGAKEIDDDDDWNIATDDMDEDGKPSANWDLGGGSIGRDDDGDGFVDEEIADGLDDDGDGLIDEDTFDGDDNGDGNCNYDPEPHIDEDPAGDMSADFIDNDFDGKVDDDDDDFDGDVVPGSPDDDGDGLFDEDGNARGTQEFFCVYDDINVDLVQNPDNDGHTPLNLQVLQRTYAWGEEYAADFIIVDLIIRNIGEIPIEDVYLGLFADPDIGAKGEGGDPASLDDWNYYWEGEFEGESIKMMIQGDDSTDSDGDAPGVFGMQVLRSPAPLEDLNVAFQNFERVAGGDPDLNFHKYDMISASSDNNSIPTPILGDWRYLMGFGPKAGGWFPGESSNILKPGNELPVTVAFIAGENTEDALRNAVWAQRIYNNDFQGPAAPDQPQFSIAAYPDHIRVFWMDNSEESKDPITGVYDFEGYVIQRSSDTNKWTTIQQYDVINRLDDPAFERENQNLGMPSDLYPEGTNWRWVVTGVDNSVNPPDTTWNRVYWLDDYDVLRGWTYYYIVRAFDQGVEGAGVLVTPIGRTYQTALVGYTEETSTIGNSVQDVFVVPNPYRGSHSQEYSGGLDESGVKIYTRKLYFMNLPATGARLNIYTLSGDHIMSLDHPTGNDFFVWNMENKYDQEIVSGIYYYVVEATEGNDIKIDKFVVLK
ncbi:MAG: hypothetical protein HQ568_02470 [Calditrichaeota bacterium]|nr:hypothetical protein [Calditrichota bacterium]